MSADGWRPLMPARLPAPLAAYSHGVVVPAGCRMVRTSGQLALRADGTIPEGVSEQATLCFAAIETILKEADMDRRDIIHLSAWVTDRAHMKDYMAARDAFLADMPHSPASTLLIVSGFTRPEFLVEVEAMAARR
jgi:enamine deaminase RidA (YjgF/YER057c/UK114 family)